MKVLIVSADNLYLTPYLKFYTNIMEENGTEYKIIFWDKNNNENFNDNKIIRFQRKKKSPLNTILGYIKYRIKIKKLIRSEKFDFIICLHPIANLIIWPELVFKFKKNYIYDVRDYSYEKFFFVRCMQKSLVKNSRLNIISSEGYKSFLPKADYEITHNLPELDCSEFTKSADYKTNPIVISYIGLIRFMDQNKKIIDFFANDSRFELRFVGTNADYLQKYCEDNKISNVICEGTFAPEETLKKYSEAHIIMNLYGNNTPLLDFALSNKLYFAATLHKPILVCPNTFMEKISVQNGFGLVLKMESDAEKDHLYNHYLSINNDEFEKNCDKFMTCVKKQQKELIAKVSNIFS